jgi:hypothetical protein
MELERMNSGDFGFVSRAATENLRIATALALLTMKHELECHDDIVKLASELTDNSARLCQNATALIERECDDRPRIF